MRILKIALLLGILGILTGGLSAAEKSAKGTQPVYTIHTVNDTIWVRFGETLQPALLSKLHSPDSTYLEPGQNLLIYAGKDTLTIPPTTEMVRIWMTSLKDTVLELVFFREKPLDAGKLELLRKYNAFGHTLPDAAAPLQYASPTDSNLARLRAEFHLDSIAGSGDEFSRQRNLLRWVHKRIRHQGVNSTNPFPANADHIIEVCDHENRGVNCRMLAVTLNEIYLAMGFKSRHLTCLPYDTADQDCHVINMVWSKQYGKWLYMDPTYDAYWMDTNRVPLSPWQVRQAMEIGDSLILADSINWNGQPHTRLDYYNYIAKNLFRCMAPAVSSYGYESTPNITEFGLYPSQYHSQWIGKSDSTEYKGTTYKYTDDPDWFFAPPQ